MQYVSEGKRVKESDIPVIARFIVEVVRRYPSTVEMFESFFQDSLKLIGSQNEKAIQSMKKMVFLLYCELCLCGVIGKENVVGKMLKAVIDTVSSKDVCMFHNCSSRLPFPFITIFFYLLFDCTLMNLLVLSHFSFSERTEQMR